MKSASRWTAAVRLVSIVLTLVCTASFNTMTGQGADKQRPPAQTQPVTVSLDPVTRALEGWELIGSFTMKGTEEDAIREAGKKGAEGILVDDTVITSGGKKIQRVADVSYDYMGRKRVTWKTETTDVKMSKGFRVEMYRRGKPNAQAALSSFCEEQSAFMPSHCTSALLKRILASGGLDLNSRTRTTALYRAVARLLDGLGFAQQSRYLIQYRYHDALRDAREMFCDMFYRLDRATVSDHFEIIRLLMAAGADPSLASLKAPESTPLGLVTEALEYSTNTHGDTVKYEQFAEWRDADPALTVGHKQAVLHELQEMLTNPGKAAGERGAVNASIDEPKQPDNQSVRKGRSNKLWTYPEAPPMTIDPGKSYTATFETTKGDVAFKLFAKEAPVSVNNFVFLAREGFYDTTIIHGVRPGQWVAGGVRNACVYDEGSRTLNRKAWGSGYTIPPENSPHRQDAGALEMNTVNGSEFLIWSARRQPFPFLNPKFPVFGQVTSGMDVLQKLKIGDVLIRVTVNEQ